VLFQDDDVDAASAAALVPKPGARPSISAPLSIINDVAQVSYAVTRYYYFVAVALTFVCFNAL